MKAKHRQIFETLSRDIRAGRYHPGQKFPSEAALMNRFHVSRITAGRAVRDLQERGMVERFAGSGTYVTNSGAKNLTFGLIIPDLGTTEIFEPICQAIASSPAAAGHALLWPHAAATGASREQQALELCEQCIARKVSGVFCAPLEMTPRASEVNRQVAASLKRAAIPVVYLDRRPEDPAARVRFDLVSVDNQRAGYFAADHLIRCGARHIAFLAWHGQASSVAGRIAGYRQALSAHRRVGRVFYEIPANASRFDGYVCSNDRLAGHLMLALLAKGVRIPQDIRIVGIDDVTYAALLPVPLTTVRQPCAEIGETALQLLLDRIAHPRMPARDVLLDCELIVRKSCGFQVTA
jgi:GntR family transcriptional regulator of arabinose operon